MNRVSSHVIEVTIMTMTSFIGPNFDIEQKSFQILQCTFVMYIVILISLISTSQLSHEI
jgi:hypothetical protein